MVISNEYKFIAFSNPKTGSGTLRKMLTPLYCDVKIRQTVKKASKKEPFYPHMPPKETLAAFNRLGLPYDEYFKFVFVRNPWARLVSLYNGVKALHNVPFDRWVRSVKPFGKGGGSKYLVAKYGTYDHESFCGDGKGNILVDQTIRLEDINEELPKLLVKLDLPEIPDVCHYTTTENPVDYREFYDDSLVEVVADLYATDIEKFHYTF